MRRRSRSEGHRHSPTSTEEPLVIAARYGRKSTEQTGVSEDIRSVTRQITNAGIYGRGKGWIVPPTWIYEDDGVSGAEFEHRPGLARLLRDLVPKPPFHVLIVSEISRLGREQYETNFILKRITAAGVRVFSYLDDQEIILETATDKMLWSVKTYAAESERENASRRTAEALLRKAQLGHVTGGRTFGYDNVEVLALDASSAGRGKRSHVEWQINDGQASVVRQIFQWVSDGLGYKRIAHRLNDTGALAPLPSRKSRPRGWSPSTVRAILQNPLYRGERSYNRTRKRDQWGVRKERPRSKDDWVSVALPHLRIVSDELWQAAQERIRASRDSYLRGTGGVLHGRPVSGVESKYLLIHLAQCDSCGGSLYVRSRAHGGHRAFFFGCSTYHNRGRAICSNGLEVPMAAANQAVLKTIVHEVLDPAVVARTIEKTLDLLERSHQDEHREQDALESKLRQLDAELGNLTAAIALGKTDIESLVAGVQERQRQRARIAQELQVLRERDHRPRVDRRQIEREIRARLTSWQDLLGRQIAQARQILRTLLPERLVFRPHLGEGHPYYEFSGRGALDRLLAGVIDTKGVVAPRGFAT